MSLCNTNTPKIGGLFSFDGKHESWKSWKERVEAYFVEDDEAYEIIIPPEPDQDINRNVVDTEEDDEEKEEHKPKKKKGRQVTNPVAVQPRRRFSRVERKIFSVLKRYVHSSVYKVYDGLQTGDGKAHWNALLKKYEGHTETEGRIYIKNYVNMQWNPKQQEAYDIDDYLHQAHHLKENIIDSKVMPPQAFTDTFQIVCLLTGIEHMERFQTIITWINAQKNLTIEEAEELLVGVEERSRREAKFQEDDAHALRAREVDTRGKCFICQQSGHFRRDCKYVCKVCKKTGHHEKKCFWGPGGKYFNQDRKESANATHNQDSASPARQL